MAKKKEEPTLEEFREFLKSMGGEDCRKSLRRLGATDSLALLDRIEGIVKEVDAVVELLNVWEK